ncbi:hypothetical protein H0H81_012366 [Sphagnurus paluster]|uniref:Uncharacterized protein n=1 Tax=Sphagnurus paluster TaxID=117069 RepID=A0A9P7GUY5_9AGAR|nr:hypothetical protein H0H81_012366 [Sphagnurus paluster]
MASPTQSLDSHIRSASCVNSIGSQNIAAEGFEAVNKSVRSLRLVSTKSFLKKYISLSSQEVNNAYKRLCEKGFYSAKQKRWTAFPTQGAKVKEDELYAPFAATNNVIAGCFDKPLSGGLWLDRHSVSNSQTSPDPHAACVRPDCLYASAHQKAEIFDNLERSIEGIQKSLETDKSAKLADMEALKRQLVRFHF